MITHFYSDPHFGHENVISFANRPFKDAAHMEKELVYRYNNAVGQNDTVLWCGDCFFCSESEAKRIMSSLNGNKIAIIGNHDRSEGWLARVGFALVTKEMTIQIGGVMATVCHYPFLGSKANGHLTREGNRLDDRYADRRPLKRHGYVLIHGHTHKKLQRHNNEIHVGVDAWNYTPVPISEIEKLIKSWKGE